MKVLIAIKGCEAHRDRWKAQLDTWADTLDFRADYFTGKFLGVSDDYEHLPHKTQAICQWAVAPQSAIPNWSNQDYDFSFFCDTDTYVHVSRLLSSGFEQHDYIGHQLEAGGIPYASGGAGYWLSRRAMKIIEDLAIPDMFKAEDFMVGSLLYASGIKLHHDPRYTLALDSWPEPGNDIITKHLSMNGPYKVEMMYEAHRRAHEPRI
jgi:hypothetical protein